MPKDWTREEVEAAVADYLVMLRLERAGLDYNKSEHRRLLAQLLNDRSKASIEFKHQNISAVLRDLGIPYVDGYKPMSNYQQLLYDIVAEQAMRADDLHAVLRKEAVEPAQVPTVDDILAARVKAPTAKKVLKGYGSRGFERPNTPRVVDYPALESANRSLGAAGEEFIVRFEQARLLAARKERLAAQVERVSVSRGDGLGYDVLSFEPNGHERLIEVKTTAYPSQTPFLVTRNEVEVSQHESDRYHVARVFDFRRRPRFYEVQGQIERSFYLDPVQFSAYLRAG